MSRRLVIAMGTLLLVGGLIAVWVARREPHRVFRFLDAIENAEAITVDIDVADPNWRMTDSFHLAFTDPREVRAVATFFSDADPNLASGMPQFLRSRKRDRLVTRFSLAVTTSAGESHAAGLSTDSWIVLDGDEPVELRGFSANEPFEWLRGEGWLSPLSRPVMHPPPATMPVDVGDWRPQVIAEYLQREYPAPPSLHRRLYYMPSESELYALDTPALREFLPETRFFVAQLSTNYHNLRKVGVLFSVAEAGDTVDIRECLSPMFEEVWPGFLDQFVGLRVESDQERERLCSSIAGLLAAITHGGNMRGGTARGAEFIVELWRGRHQLWRNIVFRFDASGRLNAIEMVNPNARP
jgi:hypothetical protein